MKLTEHDKELIISWGHPESDFEQIEDATRKTVYTLGGKRISAKRAIEVLGREQYLSGIAGSAYHVTAMRVTNEGEEVRFNSLKLFR